MVTLQKNIQHLIQLSLALLLALLLTLLFSGTVYAATLSSKVNRTELSLDETIELNVVYSGQASGEPDFSALTHQFDIVNKSQQSQVSMINGSVTANTTWHLTLLAKGAGAALIPTFHFNGESSDAIELTIHDNSKNLTGSPNTDEPLFAEVVLDKDSLYVQEQALLTVRLYTRVSLNGYSHSELELADTKVIKVSENQQYRKKIGRETYMVVESLYALFPERSGEIEIPALRFSVAVAETRSRFDSFFDSRGKTTYLHSKAQTLEVKPAPPLQGSDQWLPATQVELSQTWNSSARSADTSSQHKALVGEPITRTITVTAKGLSAAQLPPLKFSNNGNYRLYPDQATTEDELSTHGVTGKRIEAMAIVPTQAGTLHLPEIKLSWWDTEAEQFREAIVPGETFEVLPATGIAPENSTLSNAPSAPVEIQTSNNPGIDSSEAINSPLNLWLLASNALFLLTTLVFAVLWRRRAAALKNLSPNLSATQKPDSSKAFKAVIRAANRTANTETLTELRAAILHWARLHWNTTDILTLQQVADKAPQLALTQHFNWLDKSIYSGAGNQQTKEDSEHDSNQLAELITLLKQANQNAINERSAKGSKLQALYPQ